MSDSYSTSIGPSVFSYFQVPSHEVFRDVSIQVRSRDKYFNGNLGIVSLTFISEI